MLSHKQRSQVGLYIFILTATALALAGAGYLMGKDAPSWLETFIVAGMASLATAWRPGSVTDVAAVDAPVTSTSGPQPFIYPTATGPDNHTAANAGHPIDYLP